MESAPVDPAGSTGASPPSLEPDVAPLDRSSVLPCMGSRHRGAELPNEFLDRHARLRHQGPERTNDGEVLRGDHWLRWRRPDALPPCLGPDALQGCLRRRLLRLGHGQLDLERSGRRLGHIEVCAKRVGPLLRSLQGVRRGLCPGRRPAGPARTVACRLSRRWRLLALLGDQFGLRHRLEVLVYVRIRRLLSCREDLRPPARHQLRQRRRRPRPRV